MRMFLLSNDRDALVGMRLAGVEGKYIEDKQGLKNAIAEVKAKKDIALLLISEGLSGLLPDTVTEMKLSSDRPLLVIIPDSSGSTRQKDSISNLIRDAIGIKI